jgi:hypothetical protein
VVRAISLPPSSDPPAEDFVRPELPERIRRKQVARSRKSKRRRTTAAIVWLLLAVITVAVAGWIILSLNASP